MNPFVVGDKVQAKEKGRRHGNVLAVMCNICDKCRDKTYSECAGSDKNKVLVQFHDGQSLRKFKYDYSELEIETPLVLKETTKIYDFSPKDIRALGSAQINMPLIVPEVFDEEEEQPDTEPEIIEIIELPVHLTNAEIMTAQLDQVKQLTSDNTNITPPPLPINKLHNPRRPTSGMFFDAFLTLPPTMDRPI